MAVIAAMLAVSPQAEALAMRMGRWTLATQQTSGLLLQAALAQVAGVHADRGVERVSA